MYKKVNVVMLPANKSNMCRIIDLEDNTFKFNIQPNQDAFIDTFDKGFHVEPFHLYILSDEKIKEGDWCMYTKGNKIHYKQLFDKGDIELANLESSGVKKIIATTDKSLIALFGQSEEGYSKMKEGLSQISKSFIEYYISKYNKGNIITEIMVEYNDDGRYFCGIKEQELKAPTLKINSDNTINIKPIKDSWSRKEVIDKFQSMYNEVICNETLRHAFNKWIEENI